MLGKLQLERVPVVRSEGLGAGWVLGNRVGGVNEARGTSKHPEQSHRLWLITFPIFIATASTTVPGNQGHFNQISHHQNIRQAWGDSTLHLSVDRYIWKSALNSCFQDTAEAAWPCPGRTPFLSVCSHPLLNCTSSHVCIRVCGEGVGDIVGHCQPFIPQLSVNIQAAISRPRLQIRNDVCACVLTYFRGEEMGRCGNQVYPLHRDCSRPDHCDTVWPSNVEEN